jgi:hypothetical protein
MVFDLGISEQLLLKKRPKDEGWGTGVMNLASSAADSFEIEIEQRDEGEGVKTLPDRRYVIRPNTT